MNALAAEVVGTLPRSALRRTRRAADDGRWPELLELCERLQSDYPDAREPLDLATEAQRRLGRFEALRATLQSRLRQEPEAFDLKLRLIDAHLHCGDIERALEQLAILKDDACHHAVQLGQIAERYTRMGQHARSLTCHREAVHLAPGPSDYRYNLATALIAIGELKEAEAALDRVIEDNDADADAWYARATCRRQTAARHHLHELRKALTRHAHHPARAVALNYALGKELEDLGDHAEAFKSYARGAALRRQRLGYRIDNDVLTMRAIANHFTETAEPRGGRGSNRIFVMGLPRSGTTLVDRILSSHSRVGSLGETNDFAFAMLRAVGGAGRWDGSKTQLIELAAQIDAAELGGDYLRASGEYPLDAPVRIDKTPLNFLYLGLIRRALPGARIVHVRRHPMDSAFAMFKTLFRMGYPFSYDLTDLGTYLVAHHLLMTHWRETVGDGFLELNYDDLVSNPQSEIPRLLDFCGLGFEDAVLAPHRSTAPAATASAAQVREPIHTRSVGLWRHHREALAPIARTFAQHGLEFDS